MSDDVRSPTSPATLRFGFVAAVATTTLTVITFALALTALPNDEPYPFTTETIADQWPGDYLWMPPAMGLMVSFVILLAVLHDLAPPGPRIFTLVGLCLGVMSSVILLIDYFIQFTVMQVSLEKNQLDGWALFTQYNPNGIFIALEELGYLLMSLALLSLAPVFREATKVDKVLRWVLIGSFLGVVAALTAVSVVLGMDRGDTFEIAVITLVWTTLLVAGPLIAVRFYRGYRS
jgi:hypothetical protein